MSKARQAVTLLRLLDEAARSAIRKCGELQPFEARPKEELIRSACFAALDPHCTVFVESCYDDAARGESDLWVSKADRWDETWIEIKRAWAGPKWNNKPTEQAASWWDDVTKLEAADKGQKAFFLVSVVDGAQEAVLSAHFDNLTQRLRASAPAAVHEERRGQRIKWGRRSIDVQSRLWLW